MRVVGVMINTVPNSIKCIKQGVNGGNYYDIGSCTGIIIGSVFDT